MTDWQISILSLENAHGLCVSLRQEIGHAEAMTKLRRFDSAGALWNVTARVVNSEAVDDDEADRSLCFEPLPSIFGIWLVDAY